MSTVATGVKSELAQRVVVQIVASACAKGKLDIQHVHVSR